MLERVLVFWQPLGEPREQNTPRLTLLVTLLLGVLILPTALFFFNFFFSWTDVYFFEDMLISTRAY